MASCPAPELPPLTLRIAFAFSRIPEQSLAALAKGAGASDTEATHSLAQLVAREHLAAAGRKPEFLDSS